MYMKENKHLPVCKWFPEQTHATECCVNMWIYVSLCLYEFLSILVNEWWVFVYVSMLMGEWEWTCVKTILCESSYVCE